MKIEYDLIPVKAIIFCSQAALACFIPYKPIFQKQLGISTTQNGIIMAIEKGTSLIAPPIIGIIADKFSIHKIMMFICSLVMIAFTLPMYFIPPTERKDEKFSCCFDDKLFCNDTVGFNATIQTCSQKNTNKTSFECFIQNSTTVYCDFLANNISFQYGCNSSVICHTEDSNDVYGLTFSLLFLFSGLFMIAFTPLSSLIDATTMYMLGSNRINDFGKQRLWGAVGFGLIGLLIGFLIDFLTKSSNSDTDKDYLFAFVGLSLFQVITALLCFKLKVPKYKLQSILHGLSTLIKNIRITLLLVIVFVCGFNVGTRYAFTFWYVEQLPGSSQTLLGFAILCGCFSEIPTFFISGWIARKIGFNAMLSLGLLASALQCYLYTVLTVAWPLLLIETLHGISFALPMAAMCAYASILAPKGMTATLVGLTQGIYWGLGNMVGALVSGVLYNIYGAKIMFYINAGVGFAAAVLYYLVVTALDSFFSAREKREEDSPEGNEQMLSLKESSL